ncbi:MAG: lipoyl(octanoyl) transferase LipB [Myxococcales bacterium]|nr:lipoyl(octanoyl) transferase LipB [Myxococcales bacterium]
MSWYGPLPYAETLAEMKRLREAMLADRAMPGCLILCEHPPTVTCGKGSESGNVLLGSEELERRGIGLVPIERGGDVTYHGPGQLMVYPVVRVGVRVRAFLEDLAGALAKLAQGFGVDGAAWQHSEAGLWVGSRKLAACGLHLRRGVSIHGFSFNVCTPPEAWNCIVPCGLSGPGPISLSEAMATKPPPGVAECAEAALPLLRSVLESYGLDPSARAELL